MTKYIILTDKGYIYEKNAAGEYKLLGFSENKEDATRYGDDIGNMVQEIAAKIEFGFEDINEIKIIVLV